MRKRQLEARMLAKTCPWEKDRSFKNTRIQQEYVERANALKEAEAAMGEVSAAVEAAEAILLTAKRRLRLERRKTMRLLQSPPAKRVTFHKIAL